MLTFSIFKSISIASFTSLLISAKAEDARADAPDKKINLKGIRLNINNNNNNNNSTNKRLATTIIGTHWNEKRSKEPLHVDNNKHHADNNKEHPYS